MSSSTKWPIRLKYHHQHQLIVEVSPYKNAWKCCPQANLSTHTEAHCRPLTHHGQFSFTANKIVIECIAACCRKTMAKRERAEVVRTQTQTFVDITGNKTKNKNKKIGQETYIVRLHRQCIMHNAHKHNISTQLSCKSKYYVYIAQTGWVSAANACICCRLWIVPFHPVTQSAHTAHTPTERHSYVLVYQPPHLVRVSIVVIVASSHSIAIINTQTHKHNSHTTHPLRFYSLSRALALKTVCSVFVHGR